MSYSVKVTGISPSTTEEKLREFFSFCGSIKSIDLRKNGDTEATVHFEKAASVKTAVMLNDGTLDGSTLHVTSDQAIQDESETSHAKEGETVEQHDKPRAAIAAEYLAKGYTLSDQILQRAIEIDTKQGISKRFLNYIQSLDVTLGEKTLGPEQKISDKIQESVKSATEQAKAVDEQKGLSKMATDYYTKAISSPLGQKVLAFYTTTSKQVQDIHEEARRIAELQKAQAAQATPSTIDEPAAKTA